MSHTRSMYDRCNMSQDLKQATAQLPLTMDINKYINPNSTGSNIRPVNVESSLMRLDRTNSGCNQGEYPFCGPTGCHVGGLNDDNYSPPFLGRGPDDVNGLSSHQLPRSQQWDGPDMNWNSGVPNGAQIQLDSTHVSRRFEDRVFGNMQHMQRPRGVIQQLQQSQNIPAFINGLSLNQLHNAIGQAKQAFDAHRPLISEETYNLLTTKLRQLSPGTMTPPAVSPPAVSPSAPGPIINPAITHPAALPGVHPALASGVHPALASGVHPNVPQIAPSTPGRSAANKGSMVVSSPAPVPGAHPLAIGGASGLPQPTTGAMAHPVVSTAGAPLSEAFQITSDGSVTLDQGEQDWLSSHSSMLFPAVSSTSPIISPANFNQKLTQLLQQLHSIAPLSQNEIDDISGKLSTVYTNYAQYSQSHPGVQYNGSKDLSDAFHTILTDVFQSKLAGHTLTATQVNNINAAAAGFLTKIGTPDFSGAISRLQAAVNNNTAQGFDTMDQDMGYGTPATVSNRKANQSAWMMHQGSQHGHHLPRALLDPTDLSTSHRNYYDRHYAGPDYAWVPHQNHHQGHHMYAGVPSMTSMMPPIAANSSSSSPMPLGTPSPMIMPQASPMMANQMAQAGQQAAPTARQMQALAQQHF